MKTCVHCGVSVKDKPLYRINKKGSPGVWACGDCFYATNPEEDCVKGRQEVENLVNIIHTGHG